MRKTLTPEQAEKGKEFMEALQKVVELSKTVPYSNNYIPPSFIASQCGYWVNNYKNALQRSQYAI